MRAIVLAGGFGTRLRDTVPDLPKPMAAVAGRPFLEYVLDRLAAGGMTEITLSVGYLAESIMTHFQQSYANVPIRYAIETEPLGTGGAILHALGEPLDETFLIVNGDTLVNIDYAELIRWHSQKPSQAAMVLKRVAEVSRYGSVVESGGTVTGFLEKGKQGAGLINAGVYLLSRRHFAEYGLPGRFSLESDLLQAHYAELSLSAFVTDEYFIDIGIPEDYAKAQHELPGLALPRHCSE